MKKIVIGSKIVGAKNDPAMMAEQIGAEVVYWENLVLEITSGEVRVWHDGIDLLADPVDLVICLGWYKNGELGIYRDLAYSLAQIFESRGVKYWNSEMGRQRSTTKLSQMVVLALAGVLVPRTWFALSGDLVVGRLNEGRYIVKAAAASRGKNNHLAQAREEVGRILREGGKYYLVQEFIPNDHDMRVICFGGEPKLAFRRLRTSDDTHLNNVSQGGRAEWLDELPAELVELGGKICELLGREMGGVDFIETIDNSVQKYYCLEINAVPQLTSGTDVGKKMAALIQTING